MNVETRRYLLKELKAQKTKKETMVKTLRRLRKRVTASKKQRLIKKDKLKKAAAIDPSLLPETAPGRPRLTAQLTGLLEAIVSIATASENRVAADPRRRSEVVRSYMRLDDLHAELTKLGFSISRSATHLKLIPPRSNSIEGRRHVETVPVRICRPQNDAYVKHEDADFCFSLASDMNFLATILGSEEVIFISPDDKAIVKLGVIAAKLQTSLVMYMNYRTRLPNHDYVVASKHHLIPSVYAFLSIGDKTFAQPSAVSCKGPTAVYIRSGKHDRSNALSHRLDLCDILKSGKFKNYTHNNRGLKKVLLLRSDNGPDEAPRNPSTQKQMIQLFIKTQLILLVLISLPAGYSPFSPCERRMAPLSKQLTGVVLDHKHFGSHLSSSKLTLNLDLEKKNFQHAGERLGKLFEEMVLDKNKTVASYVKPPKNIDTPSLKVEDKEVEVSEE